MILYGDDLQILIIFPGYVTGPWCDSGWTPSELDDPPFPENHPLICQKIHSEPATWRDARATCLRENSFLLVVDDRYFGFLFPTVELMMAILNDTMHGQWTSLSLLMFAYYRLSNQ